MDGFILKGNILYSKNEKTIEAVKQGYLVCEGDKCGGVYEEIPEEYKNFRMINYRDNLIIPGMTDLHIHAPQYAFRGLGMDKELLKWLNYHAFAEEEKYADLSYADRAYDIFADDIKKSATTRACIFGTVHREATEKLMQKMEDTGIVSYVGKVNMDRNCPESICEESDASIRETLSLISSTTGYFRNTKLILTPRFIPSCSDELLRELGKLADELDMPVQSHLSENPDEVELVNRLCPDTESYSDAYARFGLFGGKVKTVMAHGVHLSFKEMELIRKNDVFIAHCPVSNADLSSGIAPLRKLINLKINVGLGSDVAGGHTLSMFRAVTEAVSMSKLYSRLVDRTCVPVSFAEAFYLGTAGGGKFFGNTGTFEKGSEFDAIVIDDSPLRSPCSLTLNERLERAFYLNADLYLIKNKYIKGKKIF